MVEKETEKKVAHNAALVLKTPRTYPAHGNEAEGEYHLIPKSHYSLVVGEKRRHSFIDNITKNPLPKHWKSLALDRYDGTTEPNEHISLYVT